MKDNPEHGRPNPLEVLEQLNRAIERRAKEQKSAQLKAGNQTKNQTRIAISMIEKGVLPDLVDVDEETHHDQKDPTERLIVQLNTRENELLLVRRRQGPYKDEVIKIFDGEGWFRYGDSIPIALEAAVLTAQQAKNQ